nr:radical SAM protein [Desulfobulbaceae bacterium]
MDYQGNVIRPPSESRSIILQVTVGCSHNKCTFCGAYKDQKFTIKPDHVVMDDLAFAAQHYAHVNRLFLADGDVLILSHKRLVGLITSIKNKLPSVKRIRLYGNAKSIRSKTVEELAELKALGLDRIYMGLESGCDTILTGIKKCSSSQQMIEAACKVRDAGIFLSVTTLLGIGGTKLSAKNAIETAQVLNSMKPNQIAALTLMPMPNTELYAQIKQGLFTLPNQHSLLAELRLMVENITIDKVQFQANHASNYLPIDCRLQKDKGHVLELLDLAIAGKTPLMPDYMRAL